ncbi:MAG: glycosyltransferase, partial [bacterium]|nr:glycosyltransferase [bacterium]
MNNAPSNIKKYISKSPETEKWQLSGNSYGYIDKVVVIPALAESVSLLKTLASLAENEQTQLNSTLVICVVNNRCPSISSKEEIEDNGITLDYLLHLSSGMDPPSTCPGPVYFKKVNESGMKIAFVDASTESRELPAKGGVGIARKIGMDLALGRLDYDSDGPVLIICLDADTLVDRNYLKEIGEYFNDHNDAAAVVAFSHILPDDEASRAAAIAYELFLRYYETGLRFANSPYAFQTIGSTMVCRADAYAAVGGMNRKRGGE